MSKELATNNPLEGVASKYDDDQFKELSKADSFLPRLQLVTSASDVVKSGDFLANHYAIVEGKTYNDLGLEVDVLVLAWRPAAMDFGAEFIKSHDPESPVYADIQQRSEGQDSKCAWGPEFLVYVPGSGYATFFMGSKSARNEAPGVKAYMHKACTLISKSCKSKKGFTWFVPDPKACSTPFDFPAKDEMLEQINKFENPPKEEEKEVAPDEDGRER